LEETPDAERLADVETTVGVEEIAVIEVTHYYNK
jgi:hypothetical protein